jgi:ribosomal protein L44E
MSTALKFVRYYCPGCRKTVTREVPRANKYLKSYCSTGAKVYRMRKVKS